MVTPRTKINQLHANAFDCDLYRLILQAERFGDDRKTPGHLRWQDAAARLRAARSQVRSMMSERDLEETS